jgi:predicted NAD/FAD-binding protein
MRIAIVGAGISGLFAAHLLSRAGHELVIYEAATYAGGHSNTVECEIQGVRSRLIRVSSSITTGLTQISSASWTSWE